MGMLEMTITSMQVEHPLVHGKPRCFPDNRERGCIVIMNFAKHVQEKQLSFTNKFIFFKPK